MKRGITIAGILLVILIAGSACHRAERRQMRDYSGMHMRQNFRHNRWMPGMRGDMFQGRRSGRMGGEMMRHGMGFGTMGSMRNMGRMSNDSTSWMPLGPGRRMLESIPNVTDAQKRQIEDLIKKQQDDIMKLREEMAAKMKDVMTTHRKDMLNIFTAEQKKFIENRSGRPGNVK